METVISVQFFHKPKTSLKNKVYDLKKKKHKYNPLSEWFLNNVHKSPTSATLFHAYENPECKRLSFFKKIFLFLAVPVI